MAVKGFVRSDRGSKSVKRLGARYVDFLAILPNGDTVNVIVLADRRVEISGRTEGGWKERTIWRGDA